MSKSKGNLIVVILVFTVLAMSSMACNVLDEVVSGAKKAEAANPIVKDWVPPSQRPENLTLEQQNELHKVIRFSVSGDTPAGQDAVLLLDKNDGNTPIVIGWLRSDRELNIPLEHDERSGISVCVRPTDSNDDWDCLRSIPRIEQGSLLRIQFDGNGGCKIGTSNSGGN